MNYTLPAAIKEGFLSPIKALTIPLKLDLTAVKQQAGDFSSRDLVLHWIPIFIKSLMKWSSTVQIENSGISTISKNQQKFRDILNERGFRAGK